MAKDLLALVKKFGDLVAIVIWFVFYFTLFAALALPVRLFTDFLGKRAGRSNFAPRPMVLRDLEDFRHEG